MRYSIRDVTKWLYSGGDRGGVRNWTVVAAAAVVSLGGALVVPPASATTVSGDRDTNAPLVIDPGSGAASLTLPAGGDLMFVQRMPVTKRVNRVTLGDLARDDSCTEDARVTLYLREHLAGDQQTSDQIAYSAAPATLTATPTKVTWQIPDTALRAGRGYSFRIGLYSGCPHWKQTTWAHDGATVNAGPARCALSPAPAHKRMWHVQGLDDRQVGCVDYPPGSSSFVPEMPTGWLASYTPASSSDIMTGFRILTDPPPPVPDACSNYPPSSAPTAYGAQNLLWRTVELSDGRSREDYVCKWLQFAPPGDQVTNGWYYALPWRSERTGTPGDMYLKLETINYDSLLTSHAPILKYDSGETFHVVSPGALTDFYVEGGIREWSNSLKDQTGEFGIANPAFGNSQGWELDLLTLDYLRPAYTSAETPPSRRSGTQASVNDFVSARGNAADGHYEGDARSMELSSGYPYKVYARATHGSDGKVWLQYWFFYYFNPDPFGVIGPEHEGDWEMVQVGLNPDLTPDDVVYAHHTTRMSCDWSSVDKTDDNPIVYVAEHSHASYFGPDRIPSQYAYDHADGNGGGLFQPGFRAD